MPNKFYILSGQGLGSVGAQLDNWGIVLDIFWTRSDQVRVKKNDEVRSVQQAWLNRP